MNRFTVEAKTPSYDDLSVVLLHAGRKAATPALRHHDGGLLLDYQVRVLREKYGSAVDLVVVLGYDRENILTLSSVKRNVRVIVNDIFDDTSAAYSTFLAVLNTTKSNIIVLYGDHVFSPQDLPKKISTGVIVCPTLKTGIGCIVENGIVTNLSYGISNKITGIALCGKDIQQFMQLYKDNLLLYEIVNMMIDREVRFTI